MRGNQVSGSDLLEQLLQHYIIMNFLLAYSNKPWCQLKSDPWSCKVAFESKEICTMRNLLPTVWILREKSSAITSEYKQGMGGKKDSQLTIHEVM